MTLIPLLMINFIYGEGGILKMFIKKGIYNTC